MIWDIFDLFLLFSTRPLIRFRQQPQQQAPQPRIDETYTMRQVLDKKGNVRNLYSVTKKIKR